MKKYENIGGVLHSTSTDIILFKSWNTIHNSHTLETSLTNFDFISNLSLRFKFLLNYDKAATFHVTATWLHHQCFLELSLWHVTGSGSEIGHVLLLFSLVLSPGIDQLRGRNVKQEKQSILTFLILSLMMGIGWERDPRKSDRDNLIIAPFITFYSQMIEYSYRCRYHCQNQYHFKRTF